MYDTYSIIKQTQKNVYHNIISNTELYSLNIPNKVIPIIISPLLSTHALRNTDISATILNMDENPAYGTKTSLRGQAYENTPEEPSYEIIPAASMQSTSTVEYTTAQ